MVKQTNNMTQWLKFFLNGIIETSKSSINTFNEIIELKKDVEFKLTKIGKKAVNGKRLLELLYSHPKVNVQIISKELNLSVVSVNSLVKTFVEIGILEEKSGMSRNRFYVFEDYVKIFR
jgi:Fic family protein